MNIRRYVTTASVVCTMAFGFAGSAFADTVSIDKTGADSNQKVIIDNDSSVTTTNTNTVHIDNVNVQQAKSGDVSATKNTSIEGAAGSGSAKNANATDASVGISNGGGSSVVVPGGGGGNQGGGSVVVPAGGGSSSVTPGAGAGVTPGAGAGNVMGASTENFGMGAGSLPEVGASVPMDVSALRAAWQPQSSAPASTLAKNSRVFTNVMLMVAAILSLVGAFGSAWWARRREARL